MRKDVLLLPFIFTAICLPFNISGQDLDTISHKDIDPALKVYLDL